jgi:1-piperideine-2-carboxylate/1-pyrroline-2-carboxylate reductase [NAD(P)H]
MAGTAQALSPAQTAQALPYPQLAQHIRAMLADPSVSVPARIVQPLAHGGSLFVMPAADARVAITKLITFVPDNARRGLPAIQGDVVVFDAQDGRRLHILHGPTVTARRTAAVSLLAAMELAPKPQGPLLIVGAGVQGRSHLEAFVQGLGVREVLIASRSRASADALVNHARSLGAQAARTDDPDAALQTCTLVVSCTSAQEVALRGTPRDDAFVCAVGAFTPRMVEWAPEVCRHMAERGRVVVDTRDADHEAGDLLQAGLHVPAFASLADVVNLSPVWLQQKDRGGPVFFKSCGWAGWDLAAARCIAAA